MATSMLSVCHAVYDNGDHCDEANTEAERVAACLLEKFTRQKD